MLFHYKHHLAINMQCSCLWARAYFVHMYVQMYAFITLGNILGCFVKLALVWWLHFSTIYWQWILWKTGTCTAYYRHTVNRTVILPSQKIAIIWKRTYKCFFLIKEYLLHRISVAYILNHGATFREHNATGYDKQLCILLLMQIPDRSFHIPES